MIECKDLKKFANELAHKIDSGVYWEEAIGEVEKELGTLTWEEQQKMYKIFELTFGEHPDNWMVP